MARFDWYQATVSDEPRAVLDALGGTFEGTRWEDMRKAPHGYGYGRRLVDGDGQVAMVWWGGIHAHPHVTFSGEGTPQGADLLRGSFPAHRVSRADVCEDYAEPGAYDRLQDLALGVARDRQIKVGTAGDHLLTKQGRTLYLGASSSHTRLRLYDKAAELRGQFAADPVRLAAVPAELARLEVQVRPQTPEAKRAASTAAPAELMGSAAWSRELFRRVMGVELQPFAAGRTWRQADDDRAYAAMLAQYGGMLRRRLVDHGSWAALGCQLGQDLDDRDAVKRGRS